MEENKSWMKLAVSLAEKGYGKVNPNPMVGAVIVKNGKLIGQGYHEHYGGLHAERNALKSCMESPQGADLYVTLEPCCHFGKTPPCTDAIIEAGIKRVYVGSADPNSLVAGKGIQILRSKGIEVVENVLLSECNQLNEIFFYFITKKRPFVTLKYAMTADGKIATIRGESKWISGELAREQVHRLRAETKGILAGIQTVLLDDPMLNCRIPNSSQPTRIICDSWLRIPLESNLVKTAKDFPAFVAFANHNEEKESLLKACGVELFYAPGSDKRVDLFSVMDELGRRGIDTLLLEGGGTLNFAMLSAGLVNRVQAYISPKLLGGENAKTPVEGIGFERLNKAVQLKIRSAEQIGEDFCLNMDVVKEG